MACHYKAALCCKCTTLKIIGAEFDFNKSEKNGEMIDYNYIDAVSILHHY